MPDKKALLIASPYGGLKGPSNDVAKMMEALSAIGFEISQCCGASATRDNILHSWHQLIDHISQEDCVVVYYSGHGGLVESPRQQDRDIQDLDLITPWRYQFLVPMDFKKTEKEDFRGILDVELSYLLRNITDKTKNVTVILDCCYAGRMVRDPSLGEGSMPKSLSGVQYHDISTYINRLRDLGQFQRETDVEENPFAVRIAAAATSETAWEYRNAQGEWCGAMTEALIHAISESRYSPIPWRTTLLRVSELVNVRFPYQHPHVDGPANRLHFSLQESITGAFHIRNEIDGVAIQAGRVSGVHDGNIYSVMRFGAKQVVAQEQLAEARVTHAAAFKAMVELSFNESQASQLPDDGAMAFLHYDTISKWPVALPSGFPWLDKMVQESRFIRRQEPEESSFILAKFYRGPNGIVLHNNHGLEVTATTFDPSPDEKAKLLKSVEQLARAQHLLALENETPDQILQHRVRVEFGLVGDNSNFGRIIGQDGSDSLTEGDRVFISLVNDGPETVHVSVFDINAVGKISRVSRPAGIDLPRGRHEVLGRSVHGFKLPGLKVSWPQGIPHTKPLEETLVIFLTSSPVDLNHLADPASQSPAGRTGLSKLEQLTWSISTGCSRKAKAVEGDEIRYSTLHIPFLLRPNDVAVDIST